MSYLETYDAVPDDRPEEKVGLVSGWIRTDWRPLFEELRRRRPIFVTPAFTLVTLYHDIVEVLSQPSAFSVQLYQPKMDPVVEGPFMLARDVTDTNWTEKGLMQLLLHPADRDRVRRLAARLADESLRRAEPEGRIETVSRLGRLVAVQICGEYFGFPGPDEATMMRWSKAFQSDMFKNLTNDPEIHAANVRAGAEMREYLRGLLREKKLALKQEPPPKPSFLDYLLAYFREDRARPPESTPLPNQSIFDRLISVAAGQAVDLPDDRVLANVAGLLIGSVETMSQAIVQIIEQFLRRDDVRRQAVDAASNTDDRTFDKLAFEALRFNPINPLVFRLCRQPYALGRGADRETVIHPGTVVFACTASGMFDDSAVPEPDEFRADRPHHAYLHFGHGPHRCLGEPVASVVIPEVVKRVMLRPGARLLEGESELDFQGGPFPEKFVIGI